ncbi:hypothetical protein BDU57DRAFT_534058 [Ampelomyces quisqualis]|uniref:Uncharacterized protein n=1 Tax=Ampelomyces quisqualis TaxID=50730 RepID=A0A6A5R2F4_AMPQU|nr:hypothetical protein BDU57DRAFT_534058 [Ampelomyces quisqualis]
MQFSIFAIAAALAATSSAAYTATNGTVSAAYPTGTGGASPSGTGSVPRPTSSAPFEGGASMNLAGSMMGMVFVGGVACLL